MKLYSKDKAKLYSKIRRSSKIYNSTFWNLSPNDHKEPINVLDIGCADGSLLEFGEKLEKSFLGIGIDKSSEMIKIAKRKGLKSQFICDNIETSPIQFDRFNVVFMSNVIHLLTLTDQLAQKINSIMKKGAVLKIGMINRSDLGKFWEYKFFPKILEYDSKRQPTISSIRNWLQKAGLQHSSTKKVLLEKRTFDINFIKRVKKRHMSSLNILSDDEFYSGINEMENQLNYLATNRQDVHTYIVEFVKL